MELSRKEGSDNIRFYRRFMRRQGLVSFRVSFKETDLLIQADSDLTAQASSLVLEARNAIEEYAKQHPGFIESYVPLPEDPFAPKIVKEMLWAGREAGVGPMAAVAGAIAEYVARGLAKKYTEEVLVENGGDIALVSHSPVIAGVYAGNLVQSRADIQRALDWLKGFSLVEAALVVKGDAFGVFGAIELVPI